MAGVRKSEEIKTGGRHGHVRRVQRSRQPETTVPDHQYRGVSRQTPVRGLPGDTQRGRAVLLRIFGRPSVQLDHTVGDIRAGLGAAHPGRGLGKSDGGHSFKTHDQQPERGKSGSRNRRQNR